VEDSTSPIWDDASIELSTLCKGKKKEKFRVSVKDYDDSDDTLIGFFRVSVDELLAGATEGADADDPDEINLEKAFVIKKGKTETGKIVVVAANTSDAEPSEPEIDVEAEPEIEVYIPRGAAPEAEEEEIILEATDDIEVLPDELFGGPNFADYISGGCQLRVIVAIDYTSSNGT
jgi:hypothetical protein